MGSRRQYPPAVVGAIALLALAGATSLSAAETRTHDWLSLALHVQTLPDGAVAVPVSTAIDFSQILRDANVPGAVDAKSLRLFQLSPDGQDREIPVQFSAAPQPRLKERALLPGTSPNISCIGEYRPNEVPEELRVAGRLSWIASKPTAGVCRYRLDFGVLREGRFIQVPYLPQDLNAFDSQGRPTPVRWFPSMQIRPQQPLAGNVEILEDRQLVTRYHIGPPNRPGDAAEPMFRRPFLHPVNGPDGIGLTEFGKAHDPTGSHAHHYSIWIAHAGVDGRDFWSERRGGLIAHEALELLEDGPAFGRLVQTTRWLTSLAGGDDLMHEKRTLTFHRSEPDFRLIDVEMEFTPSGPKPVSLGKTNFGFLAVRVAQSMTVFDGGGEIINSAGDRNEAQAHMKRATWIDQSGPIGQDRWAGVAIFDHPDNPRHPTFWHCRNDGWAGAAFNLEEGYTIEPGKPLRLKYRLCLHRYDAARGHVARRYAEYSTRADIHIGPLSPKQ